MKRGITNTTGKDPLKSGSLSIEEAAALLSVPTEMVRRWCVLSLVPGAKEGRQGWRIPARGLSFFVGCRKLEPHYSVAAAAAMLSKSPATIRGWLADGSLKALKTGPEKTDSVIIPESELMRRIGA